MAKILSTACLTTSISLEKLGGDKDCFLRVSVGLG